MSAKDGLLERYADKIVGVLGCYDRLVLSGTLTAIAHPGAMAAVLQREHIRCFDCQGTPKTRHVGTPQNPPL
jgi:hypothetical protein